METRLFRDDNQINRFITADYWQSKESFEAFKQNNQQNYEEIDSRYSLFSVVENFMGCFEVVSTDGNEERGSE